MLQSCQREICSSISITWSCSGLGTPGKNTQLFKLPTMVIFKRSKHIWQVNELRKYWTRDWGEETSSNEQHLFQPQRKTLWCGYLVLWWRPQKGSGLDSDLKKGTRTSSEEEQIQRSLWHPMPWQRRQLVQNSPQRCSVFSNCAFVRWSRKVLIFKINIWLNWHN